MTAAPTATAPTPRRFAHSPEMPDISHRAEFFADNGFWIDYEAVSPEQVEALNADTLATCRGEHGEFKGWVGPHDNDGDEQVMKQYLCVHFPHKISTTMHEALSHPAIVDTLTDVIGPDVKCMQSMLFIKAAGKPGQAWHQDEDYIPTRDRSLTGAWIALDDATIENGCLWVIPGSHQPGVLWPQHQQDDPRFDCSAESGGFPYTEKDQVPVEVPRGSIVYFNGYLLHRSLPNKRATGYRRVLVNHYMSASSLLPWRKPTEDSPQMALLDDRDIVMIAGEDPYAWKGLEDHRKPHVRPSGEGGCDR